MDRGSIIRMAREAGFDPHDMSDDFTCNLCDIERFAHAAYAAGAAAEREACARVCDELERANLYGVKECAKAIRARGEI